MAGRVQQGVRGGRNSAAAGAGGYAGSAGRGATSAEQDDILVSGWAGRKAAGKGGWRH